MTREIAHNSSYRSVMRSLIRALLAVLLSIPVLLALVIAFALSARRLLPSPEESPSPRSSEGDASTVARPHTSLVENGGKS
jgi:hypothetical protein